MKILKFTKILKSALGVVSVLFCGQASSLSVQTVAITQIAPHPSLDQIRQGVEDELKAYNPSINIIFDNANGKIETAMQIAQKFLGLSLKPDVVVPITTPSAQAVCNTFKSSKIPIVFAAVSDPYRARIVAKGSQKPITGLSDRPPLKEQLRLMKSLMPSIGKIGVLYNAGEDNSQATVEELRKLLKKDKIDLIEGVCNQTSEVSSVALSLAQKVDAIFIPNDNLVISALDAVIRVTQGKLPVFALDPESVEKGCLAAAAYDQYQMGREVGKIVVRVLQGEDAQTILVATPNQVKTVMNLKTAKSLGIQVPDDVRLTISKVIGE